MPHERIEMNPEIMDGKPVVRGTRVRVELVLRKLGAGMSQELILADHPRPTANASLPLGFALRAAGYNVVYVADAAGS